MRFVYSTVNGFNRVDGFAENYKDFVWHTRKLYESGIHTGFIPMELRYVANPEKLLVGIDLWGIRGELRNQEGFQAAIWIDVRKITKPQIQDMQKRDESVLKKMIGVL